MSKTKAVFPLFIICIISLFASTFIATDARAEIKRKGPCIMSIKTKSENGKIYLASQAKCEAKEGRKSYISMCPDTKVDDPSCKFPNGLKGAVSGLFRCRVGTEYKVGASLLYRTPSSGQSFKMLVFEKLTCKV